MIVPVDLGRTETYEDPGIVTPEERQSAFWQHDHVRLYAPDIADRLSAAGFDVELVRVQEALSPGAVRRHGILPEEIVFRCTRPSLASP